MISNPFLIFSYPRWTILHIITGVVAVPRWLMNLLHLFFFQLEGCYWLRNSTFSCILKTVLWKMSTQSIGMIISQQDSGLVYVVQPASDARIQFRHDADTSNFSWAFQSETPKDVFLRPNSRILYIRYQKSLRILLTTNCSLQNRNTLKIFSLDYQEFMPCIYYKG